MYLLAAVVFAALLASGFAGLPDFGRGISPYGATLNRNAVNERHATNVVTAVVFDYRGIDTMGEESILFAATVGVALLLRRTRGEAERAFGRRAAETSRSTSDAIRVLGLGLVGPTVLLGLYIVAHGALTPGGGFQGGAILASASMLVILTGSYPAFRRVNPVALIDVAEGTGISSYPVIGSIGLLAGSAFLTNVLPLGEPGQLVSGGMLPLLNLGVGLAVSAGLVLIVSEFLEQTFAIRTRGG